MGRRVGQWRRETFARQDLAQQKIETERYVSRWLKSVSPYFFLADTIHKWLNAAFFTKSANSPFSLRAMHGLIVDPK